MSNVVEEVVEETVAPVEEVKTETPKDEDKRLVQEYAIAHAGNGKWRIGKEKTLYASKGAALDEARARAAEQEVEDELGDIIPEGYHDWSLIDHSLIRESVMELPMNERYLADGTFNPLYDREWAYGWAYKDRQDISTWRSRGYRPVDPEDFKRDVREGKIPERVGDLVYEEGSFMAYGDAILMRIPRFIQRQRREENIRKNIEAMSTQHDQDEAFYRRERAHIPDEYISKIGLQNTLEYVEA